MYDMTMTTTNRAYKFRFYPTPEQEDLFSKTFGCVRLVYNKSLSSSTEMWRKEKKSISIGALSRDLTAWKKQDDLAFLNEVSSVALQQSQRNLIRAYQGFWSKRTGYPKFKKKRVARDSFSLTKSAFRLRDGKLFVAKTPHPLDIVWSRELPKNADPSSVTISRNRAGQWFVSILVEEVIPHLRKTDSAVGVDLGLTSFAALSTGEKTNHPVMTLREKKYRAKLCREVSKKEKGSANREKARRKLARFDQKVADRRRDYLHKLSTRLIRENQFVAIEDLNVRGMSAKGGAAKRGLNRSIRAAGWSKFRSMLEYKAGWYGREICVIDRFFPSSQMCSNCGHIDGKKELSVREWDCPRCGVHFDRDTNAALNILAAGLAASACGDDVSGEGLGSSPVVAEAGNSLGDEGIPRL